MARSRRSGAPKDVIDRYIGMVLERQKSDRDKLQQSTKLRASFRHGDGSSEVIDVQLLDETADRLWSS